MAVLSDNTAVVYDPARVPIKRQWKIGAVTDEYYRGALLTIAVATGLAVCTSADASEFIGVSDQRRSVTGTATNIWTIVDGIMWFATTYAADANVANTGYAAATAASDNPADIIQLAAGTTGQLGTLIQPDVTGTSGWFDIGIGARGARGTNS